MDQQPRLARAVRPDQQSHAGRVIRAAPRIENLQLAPPQCLEERKALRIMQDLEEEFGATGPSALLARGEGMDCGHTKQVEDRDRAYRSCRPAAMCQVNDIPASTCTTAIRRRVPASSETVGPVNKVEIRNLDILVRLAQKRPI
jgi:hypothetical protein